MPLQNSIVENWRRFKRVTKWVFEKLLEAEQFLKLISFSCIVNDNAREKY